jgi:hypothetical protein
VTVEVADVCVVVSGEVTKVVCSSERSVSRAGEEGGKKQRTISLCRSMHYRRVLVREPSEVYSVLLRVSLFDVSGGRNEQEEEEKGQHSNATRLISSLLPPEQSVVTHFPLRTSKSCKVSSWLLVIKYSPLESKEREVNCLEGSLWLRKTLAGLKALCTRTRRSAHEVEKQSRLEPQTHHNLGGEDDGRGEFRG